MNTISDLLSNPNLTLEEQFWFFFGVTLLFWMLWRLSPILKVLKNTGVMVILYTVCRSNVFSFLAKYSALIGLENEKADVLVAGL